MVLGGLLLSHHVWSSEPVLVPIVFLQGRSVCKGTFLSQCGCTIAHLVCKERGKKGVNPVAPFPGVWGSLAPLPGTCLFPVEPVPGRTGSAPGLGLAWSWLMPFQTHVLLPQPEAVQGTTKPEGSLPLKMSGRCWKSSVGVGMGADVPGFARGENVLQPWWG